MLRGLIGAAFAVLLLLAGIIGFSGRVGENSVVAGRGKQAPLFRLSDQQGHAHRLQDYAGRVVLLTFLPDLTDERALTVLRSLQAATHEFDNLGTKVLALSPADQEARQRLHQSERLSFPILGDPDRRVSAAYEAARGVTPSGPLTCVVGPEGKIEAGLEPTPDEDHARLVLQWSRCCVARMAASETAHFAGIVPDCPLPSGGGGKTDTLYGNRQQSATVLLFISSRCPCSQAYNDRLRALTEAEDPRVVRVLGIYSNADESRAEVEAHAREHRFRLHVVKDAHHALADRLKARATPEVFVLDRSGQVRYHGAIDDSRDPTEVRRQYLREALRAVISGFEPEVRETRAFGCAIAREELSDSGS